MSSGMQRWLIMVAMEVELAAVLRGRAFAPVPLSHPLAPDTYRLQGGSGEVLVACSGVGLVQAAVGLALIHAQAPLAGIVSLGVAGALSPELAAGELVHCDAIVQHDSVISDDLHAEPTPMCPGELHLSLAPRQRKDPVFSCDSALSGRLAGDLPSLRRGLLLSGSEFVGSQARKVALAARHPGALLVDMESAGLAQLARRLNLPLAACKTVADPLILGAQASAATAYMDFKAAAAAHAAEVVDALLG